MLRRSLAQSDDEVIVEISYEQLSHAINDSTEAKRRQPWTARLKSGELERCRAQTLVSSIDRAFRLITGAGLAGAGWYFALPLWAAVVMSVLGAMWFLTGVLSKCSIYYALGYSTCPLSGQPFSGRQR